MGEVQGVVTMFINLMEDAQTKAKRAKVEINDSILVALALHSVVCTNQYPRECYDWEELSLSDRSWSDCSKSFVEAHTKREC